MSSLSSQQMSSGPGLSPPDQRSGKYQSRPVCTRRQLCIKVEAEHVYLNLECYIVTLVNDNKNLTQIQISTAINKPCHTVPYYLHINIDLDFKQIKFIVYDVSTILYFMYNVHNFSAYFIFRQLLKNCDDFEETIQCRFQITRANYYEQHPNS